MGTGVAKGMWNTEPGTYRREAAEPEAKSFLVAGVGIRRVFVVVVSN